MSSLADDLLSELNGLSDDDEPIQKEDEPSMFKVPALPGPSASKKRKVEDDEMLDAELDDASKGGLVLEGGVKPSDELDESDVNEMELGAVKDVKSVAKLEGSRRMTDIIKVNHLTTHSSYVSPRTQL